MKTLLAIILLNIQPGDAVFWMPSDALANFAFAVYCPNAIFYYHADVVGENGGLITSSPEDGCGHKSTFSSRIDSGDWKKVKIMRNPNLNLEQFYERAYNTECEYDWFGFTLQWLDLLTSCSNVVMFRGLRPLLPMDNYHCISFMAYCEGLENPHYVVPWEIEGWETILEQDL